MPAVARKTKDAPRRTSPLGLNVRRLREQLELRQEDLAERTGVSRQTIIDLETGSREGARDSTVKRFAAFFRVKWTDLLEPLPTTATSKAILDAYLSSPYAQIDAPLADDELKWLKAIPAAVFFELRPTPESVHDMIQAFRHRQKT